MSETRRLVRRRFQKLLGMINVGSSMVVCMANVATEQPRPVNL